MLQNMYTGFKVLVGGPARPREHPRISRPLLRPGVGQHRLLLLVEEAPEDVVVPRQPGLVARKRLHAGLGSQPWTGRA